MSNRKNNFDFLRLIFASFVIITHSYPLSGIPECDLLCNSTNGQISFSLIGVRGFFILSGYLIFQSQERSLNLLDFYWKRILRLFPALFVVLILTILLIPFVYEGNTALIHNKSYLYYLPNNLTLYRTQFFVDGVFQKNPYPSSINGSLWTIPYEFTMYVFISFFIIFRRFKKTSQILLIITFLLLYTIHILDYQSLNQSLLNLNMIQLVDLGLFFIAGSFLASIGIEKSGNKSIITLISLILILTSLHFRFYDNLKYILLPVFFISFATSPIIFIQDIAVKIGDLSYGIYLYAFPVQQGLMYFFKLNYWELMIFSFVITITLAYFSWNLIEKRALKLKSNLRIKF